MIPKIGSYIERFEELDSTNSFASTVLLPKHPPEGTVIIAKKQSKGRGQAANKWESEDGKNLTFSMILYPEFIHISRQFEISKAISLGVADFLMDHVAGVSIKWPNDIYVGKNKIAGILMEYSIKKNLLTSCIIGIGLNINQGEFLSNAPNPVSLTELTGKNYDLEECLSELLKKFNSRYQQLINNDFVKIDRDYEQLLFQKNTLAPYFAKGSTFYGVIIGVDESGLLMIEDTENQIHKFDYKEVSFLRD